MARIITVASGKGGVGKTSISLNLSLALAHAGYRVALFDADLGLANVNILTGIYPKYGLSDVIAGRRALPEILIRDVNGIDIIPGSSGVAELADLDSRGTGRLLDGFLNLPAYDYFILDTSAGISAQVMSFCRAAHEMVLVATPEPTSLTDAYALLKVMAKASPLPKIRVIINQVESVQAAKQAWGKLRRTVHGFLSLKITPLGILAKDPNVPAAVASQTPFLNRFPETLASRCIRAMARKLAKAPGKDMPVEMFWDLCLELMPRKTPAAVKAASLNAGTGRIMESGQAGTGRTSLTPVRKSALEERLNRMEKDISNLLVSVTEIKALLHDQPSYDHPPLESPEKASPLNGRQPAGPGPEAIVPDRRHKAPDPVALDFEAWAAEKVRT